MTDEYYVRCGYCGWEKTFSESVYLPNQVSLEESAKQRLAGHSAHCEGTKADHEHGELADD